MLRDMTYLTSDLLREIMYLKSDLEREHEASLATLERQSPPLHLEIEASLRERDVKSRDEPMCCP